MDSQTLIRDAEQIQKQLEQYSPVVVISIHGQRLMVSSTATFGKHSPVDPKGARLGLSEAHIGTHWKLDADQIDWRSDRVYFSYAAQYTAVDEPVKDAENAKPVIRPFHLGDQVKTKTDVEDEISLLKAGALGTVVGVMAHGTYSVGVELVEGDQCWFSPDELELVATGEYIASLKKMKAAFDTVGEAMRTTPGEFEFNADFAVSQSEGLLHDDE